MITVMGEALIDLLVSPAGEVASVVGGAPLNTARTLARLGHGVSFLGGVSSDAFGRRIQRLLDEDGVRGALDAPLDAPTSLAIAQLDDGGAATYRFLLEGTAAAMVSPERALRSFDPDTTILHVGTLGLVLQPLAQATTAVVRAAGAECVVMVDPNCRPSILEGSSSFAPAWAAVLERADVVKVSGDDLAYLWPDREPLEAARELQRTSGAAVLFTDGAASVHVLTHTGAAELAVPRVAVVDTVGAGDAFSGGFLAQWQASGRARSDLQVLDAVVQAAQFGIRVAALTCQRAGAQPPFTAELETR